MLRVAQQLVAGPRPARSVIFIAFTGEELGLLGSAFFAANPTITGPMVGMINMDMVGRLGAGHADRLRCRYGRGMEVTPDARG